MTIADAFQRGQSRNLLKKMNIAANKYPKTNVVKIIREYFFSSNVKHFM